MVMIKQKIKDTEEKYKDATKYLGDLSTHIDYKSLGFKKGTFTMLFEYYRIVAIAYLIVY